MSIELILIIFGFVGYTIHSKMISKKIREMEDQLELTIRNPILAKRRLIKTKEKK